MKIINAPRLLHASGLNTSFHGGDGSFADYVQHMQTIIQNARVDLTPETAQTIIEANSPFMFRPEKPTRKGILLIHGLYDSPYTLREMGQQLCAQNFLVKSVLLPGHGTVPGDLLFTSHQAWIKAVEFGVQDLLKEVSEISLVGYSMGSALALYYTLLHPEPIQRLVLLAPALEPRLKHADFLAAIYRLSRFFQKTRYQWFRISPNISYVRYSSIACQGNAEACALLKKVRQLLKTKSLSQPILMIASQDDESVNTEVAIQAFLRLHNPESRLLLYSNQNPHFSDSRISIRSSSYPEQHILDLSHIGIPHAPDNPHYGKNGDYHDFLHYLQHPPTTDQPIYAGAITTANLKNHVIQRISYNPDYAGMMVLIEKFLKL